MFMASAGVHHSSNSFHAPFTGCKSKITSHTDVITFPSIPVVGHGFGEYS